MNSILLKDVNHDGYNDLIMGGNLYSAEVETPRNDASYGHILINNQDGSYRAIATEKTAFFGEGEIRAIRSIRIKGKENTFIVAQNNGYLKLFQLINQEL